MYVIAHENVRVEVEMTPLFVGCDDLEVLLVVRPVLEDFLFLIAAGDDMVEGAGKFDAGLSWHDGRIADLRKGVNNYRFKSDPIRSPFFISDPNRPYGLLINIVLIAFIDAL